MREWRACMAKRGPLSLNIANFMRVQGPISLRQEQPILLFPHGHFAQQQVFASDTTVGKRLTALWGKIKSLPKGSSADEIVVEACVADSASSDSLTAMEVGLLGPSNQARRAEVHTTEHPNLRDLNVGTLALALRITAAVRHQLLDLLEARTGGRKFYLFQQPPLTCEVVDGACAFLANPEVLTMDPTCWT